MSFAFGPSLTGAFDFGPGGFGVLGSAVAASGIDGPGYPFASLNLPADAGKEYLAWITTPPVDGVLTIDPLDFSYTWSGLGAGVHSFGFTLIEDGVTLTPERFVFAEVGVTRELGGTAVLDDGAASGAFFVATGAALYGTVPLDNGVSSGQLGTDNPSALGGTGALDDGVSSGQMVVANLSVLSGGAALSDGSVSGMLGGPGAPGDDAPLSAAEMRQLYNWLRDLHMIHGLTPGAPLVVGQTSRVAGSITQSIEDVGGATVITRG